MTKPNLKIDKATGYIVFSDDDTYECLNPNASVVLVEGDFDPEPTGSVEPIINAYLSVKGRDKDPMVPVECCTDDGNSSVRIITIDYLLRHYLEARRLGITFDVPSE